jgi:hypothetical protein
MTSLSALDTPACHASPFSGTWELDKDRSSDPDEYLEALGLGYITRCAICAAGRTLEIVHESEKDPEEWTEHCTTTVITKTTKFVADGSKTTVENPIDNTPTHTTTSVEEGGACVVSKTNYEATGHVAVIRRYVDPGDGTTVKPDVYRVTNDFTLGDKSGRTLQLVNYFNRVGPPPKVRARIVAIFAAHCPEKLEKGWLGPSDCDALIDAHVGAWEALIAQLVETYGAEPGKPPVPPKAVVVP